MSREAPSFFIALDFLGDTGLVAGTITTQAPGWGQGAGALPGRLVTPLLGRRRPGWATHLVLPPHTHTERCLRGKVTGVLPPLLVGAPRNAEVHGPVRNLGEGQVSGVDPQAAPAQPRAWSSPRSTAETGASCQPWCIPAALWRHSTCTGRWADPCGRTRCGVEGDSREARTACPVQVLAGDTHTGTTASPKS